jgi:long-chain acyl-CoA synthetase
MADTLPAVFFAQARTRAGDVALVEFDGCGRTLTWGEWADEVRACSASLLAAGHGPGERVAVFAGNGVLWSVVDVAAQAIGMVSVGIFPTAAPVQVTQVLADAGVTAAFADTAERAALLLAARAGAPSLRTIVIDAPSAPAGTHPWDAWQRDGRVGDVDAHVARLRADDDAIIIYTSGSTGEPKGARIAHRYLLASARSIIDTLGMRPAERTLSFLPFSHAAERVFGHTRRICNGDVALLLDDHRRLWDAAGAFHPTVFGGLPRFYEKLAERLVAHRAALHGERAASWDAALDLGRQRSLLRRAGAVVPPEMEARWIHAIAPQRAVLEGCLGSALRLATSGGASLPLHAAELLDACGLTVYGAYGLTEHLCVASHRPGNYGFEGVGAPMEGSTLRIADDGEILVRRCDLTFSGYLGRPADTAAMFTADGAWLRTGDIGRIEDGRLFVTGRFKELIALSTGKKVAPAPIEARLCQHPYIAQAVLYGEGRKYVTALLTLSEDAPPDAHEHVAVAVAHVNADLSSPEQVRRFIIAHRALSPEMDEITPTLKIRRSVVAANFSDQLSALYREDPG